MKSRQFFLIDPFGIDSHSLKSNFDAWVQYYKLRSDSTIDNWEVMSTKHPIQQDSYNCRILTCVFIREIVDKGFITTENYSLNDMRQEMASMIVRSSA